MAVSRLLIVNILSEIRQCSIRCIYFCKAHACNYRSSSIESFIYFISIKHINLQGINGMQSLIS